MEKWKNREIDAQVRGAPDAMRVEGKEKGAEAP